jgi:hypothetical protein
MDSNKDDINNNVNTKMDSTKDDINNNVNTKMDSTKDDINNNVNTKMDSTKNDINNNVNTKMDSTKDDINNNVNSKMDSTKDDINNNVNSKMNSTKDDINKNVNSKMDSTKDNINSNINSKVEASTSTINSTLGGKIDSKSKETNNKIDTLNSSFDQKLNSMNTSINNQMTSITNNQNNNNAELKQMLSEYQKKVDASFTSVADGKRSVASALATKNIQVANDATFEQISNAIMSIEMKVREEDLVVHCTYHHHTNGSDGISDNDSDNGGQDAYGDDYQTKDAGGCFQRPYYHIEYMGSQARKYVLMHTWDGNEEDDTSTYSYWGCGFCDSKMPKYDDFDGSDEPPIHMCGGLSIDKWTFEPSEEESQHITEVVYVRSCGKVANQIVNATAGY